MARAALFGLLAYATYDLTNLATIEGWAWQVSAIDLVWGTTVTSIASVAGYFAGSGGASARFLPKVVLAPATQRRPLPTGVGVFGSRAVSGLLHRPTGETAVHDTGVHLGVEPAVELRVLGVVNTEVSASATGSG